jgi:hypothetical protein
MSRAGCFAGVAIPHRLARAVVYQLFARECRRAWRGTYGPGEAQLDEVVRRHVASLDAHEAELYRRLAERARVALYDSSLTDTDHAQATRDVASFALPTGDDAFRLQIECLWEMCELIDAEMRRQFLALGPSADGAPWDHRTFCYHDIRIAFDPRGACCGERHFMGVLLDWINAPREDLGAPHPTPARRGAR